MMANIPWKCISNLLSTLESVGEHSLEILSTSSAMCETTLSDNKPLKIVEHFSFKGWKSLLKLTGAHWMKSLQILANVEMHFFNDAPVVMNGGSEKKKLTLSLN